MKRLLSYIVTLAVLGLTLGGCISTNGNVTFSQLISQADRYSGKTVTLEAFYFSGWEISALCEDVGPSSSGPWRIVPVGTLVWVESGIPQELQSRLYSQTAALSGYTERIGKLRVTGRFDNSGKFGHLGSYQYQIAITKAELLEWFPPPAATPSTPPATTSPPVTSRPTQGSGRSFFGGVTAIDLSTGQLVVFDVVGKKEYKLRVDDSTEVIVNGQTASLKAIAVGSAVSVSFNESTLVALRIIVGEAPPPALPKP